MYNVDWDQHKKNLKLERLEWEKYMAECQIIDERTAKQIEFIQKQLNHKIQELEEKAKKLKNKKHKQYLRNVERKFKPSIGD